MISLKWCQAILVFVATLGILFPFPARAQAPGTATAAGKAALARASVGVRDVVLGTGGTFRGTVFNAQAHRVPRQVVILVHDGRELARAESNAKGQFGFRGLRGGVYGLSLDGASHVYRVWTAAAAPPHAIPEVALVTGETVQRGQRPFCELFVSDPIVMGVILAAAIAIPVAVHNARSDRPAS
jgi:hypothetical protein